MVLTLHQTFLCFHTHWNKGLLKTIWEKKRMLVYRQRTLENNVGKRENSPLSHSVSTFSQTRWPSFEPHLIWFVVCKCFQFWQIQNFVIWLLGVKDPWDILWLIYIPSPSKSSLAIIRYIATMFSYLFNSLPNNKIFDLSKFKAFADDKIILTQKLKFLMGRVENIVGKGENAAYQHFLLFPQCFQKLSFLEVLKVGIVWWRVNMSHSSGIGTELSWTGYGHAFLIIEPRNPLYLWTS